MILSEQTFIELAGKQEVLDAKIKQAKGITELPLERIELAYRVEAAECVNEMKGDMKYWSDKPMNREAFLEEFVDALHFFLSYTNKFLEFLNHDSNDSEMEFSLSDEYSQLVQNTRCYKNNSNFFEEVWRYAHQALNPRNTGYSFAGLLMLVEHYGFTEQDIVDTYNRKNAVNHDRSDSGVY